jgi:hypothetical protein
LLTPALAACFDRFRNMIPQTTPGTKASPRIATTSLMGVDMLLIR